MLHYVSYWRLRPKSTVCRSGCFARNTLCCTVYRPGGFARKNCIYVRADVDVHIPTKLISMSMLILTCSSLFVLVDIDIVDQFVLVWSMSIAIFTCCSFFALVGILIVCRLVIVTCVTICYWMAFAVAHDNSHVSNQQRMFDYPKCLPCCIGRVFVIREVHADRG